MLCARQLARRGNHKPGINNHLTPSMQLTKLAQTWTKWSNQAPNELGFQSAEIPASLITGTGKIIEIDWIIEINCSKIKVKIYASDFLQGNFQTFFYCELRKHTSIVIFNNIHTVMAFDVTSTFSVVGKSLAEKLGKAPCCAQTRIKWHTKHTQLHQNEWWWLWPSV